MPRIEPTTRSVPVCELAEKIGDGSSQHRIFVTQHLFLFQIFQKSSAFSPCSNKYPLLPVPITLLFSLTAVRNSLRAVFTNTGSVARPLSNSSLQLWTAWLMSTSIAASVVSNSLPSTHCIPPAALTTTARTLRLAKPNPAPYNARARDSTRRNVSVGIVRSAPRDLSEMKSPSGDGTLVAPVWINLRLANEARLDADAGGLVAIMPRTIARRLRGLFSRVSASVSGGAHSSALALAMNVSIMRFL